MNTITINGSEPVYEQFQIYAKKVDRKTSELIREAMGEFRIKRMSRRTSLQERHPADVGGAVAPITGADDLLGEMLERD